MLISNTPHRACGARGGGLKGQQIRLLNSRICCPLKSQPRLKDDIFFLLLFQNFPHMKNFVFFIIIALTAYSENSDAQSLIPFTLYTQNMSALNPAAEFGTRFRDDYYNVRLAAAHRQQWIGTEDAPLLQSVSADYFPEYKNFSFGGHLQNRKTGAIGYTDLTGIFRYALKLSRFHTVTGGLSAGLGQYRIKTADIRLREAGDLIRNGENLTALTPHAGFGLQYKFKNRFYARLSAPQILNLRSRLESADNELIISSLLHLYAQAGTVFYTNRYESSFIELTAWARYLPGTPFGSVFNFRYQYDDLFWVGVGGDTAMIAHLEAGIILGRFGDRRLQIGAGYDYSFHPETVNLGHTAEISLAWMWGS